MAIRVGEYPKYNRVGKNKYGTIQWIIIVFSMFAIFGFVIFTTFYMPALEQSNMYREQASHWEKAHQTIVESLNNYKLDNEYMNEQLTTLQNEVNIKGNELIYCEEQKVNLQNSIDNEINPMLDTLREDIRRLNEEIDQLNISKDNFLSENVRLLNENQENRDLINSMTEKSALCNSEVIIYKDKYDRCNTEISAYRLLNSNIKK